MNKPNTTPKPTFAHVLLWGAPGSMTRSMKAADAVATAFDAGKLKADPGYGWPVKVEAALIAIPTHLLGEALDLIENWQGDCLPALIEAACKA